MGPDVEYTKTEPSLMAQRPPLSAGLGRWPKFLVEDTHGLHCLYLDGQDGPYIWGFIEPGEAQAIAQALNMAMVRAGCVVPNV